MSETGQLRVEGTNEHDLELDIKVENVEIALHNPYQLVLKDSTATLPENSSIQIKKENDIEDFAMEASREDEEESGVKESPFPDNLEIPQKIKCVHCDMVFMKKEYYTGHLLLVHRNLPTEKAENCVICKERIPVGNKKVVCALCSSSLCSKCSQQNQRNSSEDSGSGVQLCTNCSNRKCFISCERLELSDGNRTESVSDSDDFSTSEPESSRSQASRKNDNIISCIYCKKTFEKLRYFSGHLRLMHPGKPYLLMVTGRKSSEDVQEHCLNQKYLSKQCVYCDETFPTRQNLVVHVHRMHRGFPTEYSGGCIQCKFCNKILDGIKSLTEHIDDFHVDSAPQYECADCGKRYKYFFMLKKHLKKHKRAMKLKGKESSLKYKCTYCKTTFKIYKNFMRHMKTVHRGFPLEYRKSDPIRCTFCNKSSSTLSDLKNHVNEEHPRKTKEKNWTSDKFETKTKCTNELNLCQLCAKTFKSQVSLDYHLIVDHATEQFKCPECPKTFKTKFDLKNHSIVHTSEESNLCQICGKTFKTYRKLNRHVYISHQTFKCEICSKSFNLYSTFQTHKKHHIVERNFKCFICQEDEKNENEYSARNSIPRGCFRTKNDLIYHMKRCHGEKIFKCSLCPSKFSIKSSLKRHVMTHNDDKSYVCKICQKRFNSPINYKKHFQRHEFREDPVEIELSKLAIERPFKCHSCDKRYRRRVDMQIHAVCHLTESNFKCQQCPRAFKSDHLLRRHNADVHSGERPCTICGKILPGRWSYNRHMYEHRMQNALKCHICSKTFIRKLQFCRHMNTDHDLSKEAVMQIANDRLKDIDPKKQSKKRKNAKTKKQ